MYVLRHILKDITDDIQTLLFVGNIILTLEIVVGVAKKKLEHVQPIQA